MSSISHRIDRMCEMLGHSKQLLSFFVCNLDEDRSPLRTLVQKVCEIRGSSIVGLADSGLKIVADDDIKKCKEDYDSVRMKYSIVSLQTEDSWREGLRRLGDVVTQFATFTGNMSDNAVFAIALLETSRDYDAVRQAWPSSSSWTDRELDALATAFRWMVGYRMGRLNLYIKDLAESIITHQDGDLRSVRYDHGQAQRKLLYEFLTKPWDRTLLLRGEGTLPFNLAGMRTFEEGRAAQRRDRDLVDRALQEVCRRRNMTTADAKYKIRLAPWFWVSQYQGEDISVGMELVDEILVHVQTTSGHGYGPIEVLWDHVVRYLDPQNRDGHSSTGLNIENAEQRNLIARMNDRYTVVSPTEMDRAFPNTAMFVIDRRSQLARDNE